MTHFFFCKLGLKTAIFYLMHEALEFNDLFTIRTELSYKENQKTPSMLGEVKNNRII